MSVTSVVGHLAFGIALNALLLLASLGWLSRFLPPAVPRAEADDLQATEIVLSFGVVLSACVVLLVTVGGTLGVASRPLFMMGITAVLALLPALGSSPQEHTSRLRLAASGLASSIAELTGSLWQDPWTRVSTFCVLAPWLLLFSDRFLFPPVAWDALTYHLSFPLHWLQAGRLETLVMPTGDPSQTFYPLNGEMLFYWAFLSTGSDAWAAMSQVPFAILGAVAVAGIARTMRASTPSAWLAGALWVSLPIVLRQSVEPMVDIAIAAFATIGAFLLLRWRKEGRPWRIVLAAAALGLAVGTKYLGLIWAASALLLVITTMFQRRHAPRIMTLALCIGLLVLLGGYAYARNAWVSGNPLLPLDLKLGDVTLLHGSRSVGQYAQSDLHRSPLSALVASPRALLDLGPLAVLSLIVTSFTLLRRSRPGSVPVAATSLFACLVFMLAVPYREPRFLLFPLALSLAVSATFLPSRPSLLIALLPLVSAPLSLFYWVKDLYNNGIGVRVVVGSVAVLVLAALCLLRLPRLGFSRAVKAAPFLAAAVGCVLLILIGAASLPRYEATRFAHWNRFWSTRIPWGAHEARADLADAAQAWSLLADRTNPRSVTVGYAGTNIPYPLAGIGLQNRFLFVPRSGGRDGWKYDWKGAPTDPARDGSEAEWMRNVKALDVQYLCVLREARAGDSLEFIPPEETWADAHEDMFRRVWTRNWVRIYEVRPAL